MKKYLTPIAVFISIISIIVIFAALYVLFTYFGKGVVSDSRDSGFLSWFSIKNENSQGNATTTYTPDTPTLPIMHMNTPDNSNPNLPFAYTDDQYRFAVNLPNPPVNPTALPQTKESTFTIDTKYSYDLRPGIKIPGIKFTIPTAFATGTNLSSDTYISIERYPSTITSSSSPSAQLDQLCTASMFLDGTHEVSIKNESIRNEQTTYSVATSSNAGAGNRYEETIYALKNPEGKCYAIRYLVHYGVLQNYPEGSIHEFDNKALTEYFDQIRKTVVLFTKV